MLKINRYAGITLSLLLFGSFGMISLSTSAEVTRPLPAYHQMVENDTIRNSYIDTAWSNLSRLAAQKAQDVRVTVTLRRSLSWDAADQLTRELGLELVAWDAMVGKGTVHRKSTGSIANDIDDVVRLLKKEVDANITAEDLKVVALYGRINPADAIKVRSNPNVLAIDPTGDSRVSGAEKHRFAPHLFWTLPDYRNK
ncbi:hypothetical protein JCM14720_19420 [Calditerricola yamamurae]